MTGQDDQELDVLDIEEYARAGKEKPKARRYRVRIDRTHYETTNPNPSGREILALAQAATLAEEKKSV